MCIYSSPLDQKGACRTSLTSLLMQYTAACQKHRSLRSNQRFVPAGQGCSLGTRRVSCRMIFPTGKDQRQDSAGDLAFHSPAVSKGWSWNFCSSLQFFFFLEDPTPRHPNACRSTEAKRYHCLLKTLTSSPPPTSMCKVPTPSRLGRVGGLL